MSLQIAPHPSPTPFSSELYLGESPTSYPSTPVDMGCLNGDDVGPLDIQRALDIARNTEGDLEPSVSEYLETQLSSIWSRIEAGPEQYIMTKDEFAVFNFFVNRFQDSQTAERAIARFWANHQEKPGDNSH